MNEEESFNLVDQAIATSMSLPPSTIPMLAGYAAFASSLALSTFLQIRLLGVSTGSHRPIPSLVGLASVALSSLASHNASIKAHAFCRQHPESESSHQTTPITAGSTMPEPHKPPAKWQSENLFHFGSVQIEKQTIRVCVLGMLTFQLLGGRFWAVAPSSYTHLGSFARFSLPATEKYATSSQRAALERLGRWVGCHTCGSHMFFRNKLPRFHGDHMPPKAVAQQMNAQWFQRLTGMKVKFRFFPQCIECSNMQGKILSSATNELRAASFWNNKPNLKHAGGGNLAYFHGFRFRPFHLAGTVIAAVTVVDACDDDIDQGNRRRYYNVQERIEDCCRDAREYVRSVINR